MKQGDPLAPILFNLVLDRMIEGAPKEIGFSMNDRKYNILIVSSTENGLQQLLDYATGFLKNCGLNINTGKSFMKKNQLTLW